MSAETIIEEYKVATERGTAQVVADDMQRIILDGEQFGSSSPEIGADLDAVGPFPFFAHPEFPGQLIRRSDVKRKLGQARPDTPRFGTGELVGSIAVQRGQNGHMVAPWDLEKAAVHQYGGGPWTDEMGYNWHYGRDGQHIQNYTPPRPFVGVSRRALDRGIQVAEDEGVKAASRLDGISLTGTINL